MTQTITLDPSEIPGKHLVEGQDMINMAAAINSLTSGGSGAALAADRSRTCAR